MTLFSKMQSLLVTTNHMELQVEYDSHCQLCWTRLQFPYLQDKVLISPDDRGISHCKGHISSLATFHQALRNAKLEQCHLA